MIPEEEQKAAIETILAELEERLPMLGMIEAHRLKQRTLHDMEMISETGSCKGIENYSRHFDRRQPDEAPYCLIDYFPEDFLLVIDESHQTLPQLRAMYNGDRSRKKSLVDYGFRLPSAYDNRPLRFEEFETHMRNVIFVSATPGSYELEHSAQVVEQIIRPTGLLDPLVEIRPIEGQVRDVMTEIALVVEKGDRALVTTLTKRLAEELTDFLAQNEIKARYLHSDIDTLERTEIIRELRLGKFDVLVGINLLREGLDIPEVGFIGILDADKEGFLRDEKSLIQTIGRASRNANSRVVLYADRMTGSIRAAVEKTEQRRATADGLQSGARHSAAHHQEAHPGEGGGDHRHQAHSQVRHPQCDHRAGGGDEGGSGEAGVREGHTAAGYGAQAGEGDEGGLAKSPPSYYLLRDFCHTQCCNKVAVRSSYCGQVKEYSCPCPDGQSKRYCDHQEEREHQD